MVSSIGQNPSVNTAHTSAINGELDISQMDIESAICYVVQQRVTECEKQVQSKVADMQARNQKLKALGEAQTNITAMMKDFPADAKSTTNRHDGDGSYDDKLKAAAEAQSPVTGDPKSKMQTPQDLQNKIHEIANNKDLSGQEKIDQANAAIREANVKESVKEEWLKNIDMAQVGLDNGMSNYDPNKDVAAMMKGEISYGSLETLKQQISAQVDSLGNDAQMDQIALQSWTTKYTNANQLLSTLMKKFDDAHAGIIRNT
jgi:hypothetical protein